MEGKNLSLSHNIILLAFSCFLQPVLAADDQGVLLPSETVELILGTEIKRTLPANFPLVPLPGGLGLRLQASVESGSSINLYMKASKDYEDVLSKIVQAYSEAGWQNLSGTSSLPFSSRAQLCHESLGNLHFTPIYARGLTSASAPQVDGFRVLYSPPVPESTGIRARVLSCTQMVALQDAGYSNGMSSYYQKMLPVLELPENAGSSSPLGGLPVFSSFNSGPIGLYGISSLSFNLGGSVQTNSASTEISDTSSIALYEHFASQLLEQGWNLDSAGEGAMSVSSVWKKTINGVDVSGVYETGGIYQLNLALIIQQSVGDQYLTLMRMDAVKE